MKKIIVFLLTIICIGISYTNVKAETFYEAEYIDGIYTKTVQSNGNGKYQKARFFRRSSDNKEAYCIEPLATFQQNTNYLNVPYARGIDPNTWNRMVLVAHYGYGYNNHTDPKWYAITQMMIWRLAVPTADFYFTNGLNGPRIDAYTAEINEINALADNFNTLPNMNSTTTGVVGDTVIIEDTNNVLNNYTIENTQGKNIRIENNKLIYENITEGPTHITLTRSLDNEPQTSLLYYNTNSQNLLVKGNTEQKKLEIIITGTTNEINITKLDKDTNSTNPSGEAILKDAIYGLYDTKDNLLQEITFDENSFATIKNIAYGTYYLKEIKAGAGYTINEEKTNFTVDQNTTTINIELTNKVIEKEIIIHKEYGTKENTTFEEGISFDIYDNKENLIDTITTDNEGNAKIKLPYGKYIIKQRNTNNGYTKVKDFEIEIDDDETKDYYYKLYDYKIDIPNTGIKKSNSILLFLILIPFIYYFKRKNKIHKPI